MLANFFLCGVFMEESAGESYKTARHILRGNVNPS
jgi:hypothetical protein